MQFRHGHAANEPLMNRIFMVHSMVRAQCLPEPKRFAECACAGEPIDPKEGHMSEYFRSAVLMLMGVVVMGAGVAVVFYG